jgi:hypothetical protein
MTKVLCPHWVMQQVVDEVVALLAPGQSIVPVLRHDQIVWDEECPEVGRASWHVGYFRSPNDAAARKLIPSLNAAMVPYQALYDLGVTCERR